MKYLKPYNEKKEDGELEIVDEICMELSDTNLRYRTECNEYGTSSWTSRTAFLNVYISLTPTNIHKLLPLTRILVCF